MPGHSFGKASRLTEPVMSRLPARSPTILICSAVSWNWRRPFSDPLGASWSLPSRMNGLMVQDTKAGAILSVHVQPKASTTECVGIHGDALKIRVAAPPVDGAANDELIRFLARSLSIPSTSLQIYSGASGRHE